MLPGDCPHLYLIFGHTSNPGLVVQGTGRGQASPVHFYRFPTIGWFHCSMFFRRVANCSKQGDRKGRPMGINRRDGEATETGSRASDLWGRVGRGWVAWAFM